ncbi:ethanolamine ammonia-lyase subunit EutC [Neptuniibacter halophilus]|uniref:ethanolamine ammonia-lyase subunit EutC n=1 Tax=Neptuniibacter halophilus TaxID=651666 RepID=UPI002573B91B|nr:ethanolamine ammonia-lyase subunit EutC [Neptuniibacter halophilus]
MAEKPLQQPFGQQAGTGTENSWSGLRRFTDARIGLGRTGSSLTTQQMLAFQMDHANARDAVHIPLDLNRLQAELPAETERLLLNSQAVNRQTYLQRPDLGRALSAESRQCLQQLYSADAPVYNAAIVIADGLSSTAVQAHAARMTRHIVDALSERDFRIAPLCLVNQGRVAIGDEIGQLLGVELLILMIGERPGLSSPDSLGIYYTYQPRVGLQDSSRNCISNIRPAGLSFQDATDKLIWLIGQSIRIRQSGVMLKDESEPVEALSETERPCFLLDG